PTRSTTSLALPFVPEATISNTTIMLAYFSDYDPFTTILFVYFLHFPLLMLTTKSATRNVMSKMAMCRSIIVTVLHFVSGLIKRFSRDPDGFVCWGYGDFIRRDELLNAENAFLSGDKLTVHCEVCTILTTDVSFH